MDTWSETKRFTPFFLCSRPLSGFSSSFSLVCHPLKLLGMWMTQNESAKFWLSILTELQNRGLKDIFIACCDGLSGFADAIEAVFPKTQVQLCLVHRVRNSLSYVSYKDRKAVAADSDLHVSD